MANQRSTRLDRLADGAKAVLDATGWGPRRSRRARSTRTSGTGTPRSSRWGARGWTSRGRSRSCGRCSGAQWADGRVPHIVFNPSVGEDAYFPGPAFWQSSQRSASAPRGVETSGHHPAAAPRQGRARDPPARQRRRCLERVPRAGCTRGSWPRTGTSGPAAAGGVGLAVIVHPWESGLDNSPAWDRDLEELVIPAGASRRTAPRPRPRPAGRPAEQRGVRPVRVPGRPYRDSGYDDFQLLDRPVPDRRAAVQRDPGVVGPRAGRDRGDRREDPAPHREAATDSRGAPVAALGPGDGPVRGAGRRPRRAASGHGRSSPRCSTRSCPRTQVDAIWRSWPRRASPGPAGRLRRPSMTSGPGFDRRRYWRGPIWINTNWLIWSGLRQHGRGAAPDEILPAASGWSSGRLPGVLRPVRRGGSAATGSAGPRRSTLDVIERHQGADRAQLVDWLAEPVTPVRPARTSIDTNTGAGRSGRALAARPSTPVGDAGRRGRPG